MMRKKFIYLFLTLFTLLNYDSAQCQTSLQTQLSTIAKGIHGNIGAYVSLIETDESASINGTKHFPMQSVYKFPIAMAVLSAVDKGRLKLNQMVEINRTDFIPAGHSPLRDKYPNGT